MEFSGNDDQHGDTNSMLPPAWATPHTKAAVEIRVSNFLRKLFMSLIRFFKFCHKLGSFKPQRRFASVKKSCHSF